jgi:penicillin amidase
MPGIVLGHTPGVAWGFTNAYLDDMDLFVERVDPADTTRYLTPEGSAPFEQRIEEIWVRGREVPDTIVVRSTRHGPVMTPVESRAGEDLLSLQWIAHDTTHAQRALLKLLRVQTAGELLLAMQDMDVAHQNVVFADTAGAWGYWMAGRIPVRPTGTARLLPVPGWTGEGDWLGYLPFSEHPHQLAPERGFIATANNRQSWAPVSWQVSEEVWAEPFRAMRITERLSAGRNLTADSMAALQNDVTSSFAQRYLPAAVRAFQGAGYDSIAASLETWDGAHTLDDTRAPVFHAWVRALQGQLRRAELGSDEAFFPRSLVERRLDAEAVADELAVEAAREARAQVAGMSWGQVHTLTLDHPLAAVPALRTLFGFGRVGVPRQGGPHTVDVAEMSGSAPAWVVRWGASQRHVVDMADPDATGTFVIPGGASGWPGDDLTMSQFDRWLAGERISVPLSRERVEARTIARLQLRP